MSAPTKRRKIRQLGGQSPLNTPESLAHGWIEKLINMADLQ